jgi:hypothetical protein
MACATSIAFRQISAFCSSVGAMLMAASLISINRSKPGTWKTMT